MANIDFNIVEMEQLQREINQEIIQVENLLTKVNDCLADFPADNDTYIKIIEETNKQLHESWNNLIGTFKSVGSFMESLIKRQKEAVEKNVEKAKQIKTSL